GAVTGEPEIAHVKDVEVESAPLRGEGVTDEGSGDGRRIGQQGRAEVSPGPFLLTDRSVPVGHGHESFEPCMPRSGRIRTEFPDRIGPCSHGPLTKQPSKACELALLLVFFPAGPLMPGLTLFPLPLFLLGGLFGGMPLFGPPLVLGGCPGECPSQSSTRD